MAFTIALAGKGGTGKTTTAALIIRALNELGAKGVLAVDADPNSTLHEALGVTVERSVGEITEDMLDNPECNPGGMAKDAWLEYNLHRYMIETPEFDLVSMGRPEGAGCYCYANNLVRGCIDTLSSGYGYVVIDNEAGLEHLSRRTTRDVDLLLVISDAGVRGIRTAARLSALVDELKIHVARRYLVLNRAFEPLDPGLSEAIDEAGVPYLGAIPTDIGIVRSGMRGGDVYELPTNAPALEAVRRLVVETVLTPANA